jgi:hypothetical protein
VLLLVGVAGVSLCLTLIFLAMRAVLELGGTCGNDNGVACPDGVPLSVVAGIVGSIGFGAMAAAGGRAIGGQYRGIASLAVPALFIGLGWNFLEYGVRPPGGGRLEWGALVSGVLLVLVGGAMLLTAIQGRSSDESAPRRDPRLMRRLLGDLQARQRQLTARAEGSRTDLTSRLERLSALHRAGSLTDAEFDEAKRRVIAEKAAGR